MQRKPSTAFTKFEFIIAVFALTTLLWSQWVLSAAIHGTNYYGLDGKMVQATIIAMLRFGGLFDVTNLNPLQGIGTQMLTKNAWANPAFWPFGFLEKELATDVSAVIALGFFAIACYVMARCFDAPPLPAIVAAQLCIILFAPALLVVRLPTNFCLTPGDAIVYAPFMIALGLLGRMERGSWRRFSVATAGLFALFFYSIYSDPLWVMIAAVSWAVPFAVVTLGPMRLNTIIARCAALGCCLILLLLSGAIVYLYTLSQYTARVQFAEALDRERSLIFVSAVTYSPNMKYIYVASALGWLLGLVTLRGRVRLLIAAGATAFGFYLAYSVVYLLLLNAVWRLPIPLYMEQCLIPLYIAGAIAGYWGALQALASRGFAVIGVNPAAGIDVRRIAIDLIQSVRIVALRRNIPRLAQALASLSHLLNESRLKTSRSRWVLTPSRIRAAAIIAAFIFVAIIPARVAEYAVKRAKPLAEIYHLPWQNEPELIRHVIANVGLEVGQQFRGSINLWNLAYAPGFTATAFWANGVPTVNEHSQLVTPQILYVVHKLLKKDIRGHLNFFIPNLVAIGSYSAAYWNLLQMFGVRYTADVAPLANEFNPGFPLTTLPHRPYSPEWPVGLWYLYELPHPNVGDYSPTEVVTAQSGDETMAAISSPHFDFTRQVVLSTALGKPLVRARDMRMSIIRGGLHVSGRSDGTSLVVLPQQFSNCLRARDNRVRIVRANLMMTGIVFSGDIDTDILFDYGIVTPYCRLADLADMKVLNLKIDLQMVHLSGERLFPDWDGAWARLRTAASAIQ